MPNFAARRGFSIAARLAFALFALLTSIYALLAYIPDTYFAFIQAPFQSWLVALIRFHPYLYCGLLACLMAGLWAENREGRARRMGTQFILFHAAVAVYFLADRPFSHLGNNSLSFLWSVVALFPLIWIGILDHSRVWQWPATPESQSQPRLSFRAVVFAAIAIGLLYPGMDLLRHAVAGRRMPLASVDFLAWGWAVAAQILFAILAASLFNLPNSLASQGAQGSRIRFLLYHLLAWGGIYLVFQRVLLASIPFIGWEADLYAAAISFALVIFFSGLVASGHAVWQARGEVEASSGRQKPFVRQVAVVLVLLVAIYAVPGLIGVLDWNSVLEKLWSLILWWCVLLALLFVWPPKAQRKYPVALLLLLGVGSFEIYRVLQMESLWPRGLSERKAALDDALVRHAASDASYQAVRDFWAAAAPERPCDPLCQFLKEQTNIPAADRVTPVDVKLVEQLTPTPDPKPNIFLIVVDSLRQNYLSPYNPDVKFTPEIGRFAADSVVMHNAFTRYGGTTLSEPAIWAGSLLLHKHYVLPFHPLNNLEKMLDVDGYERFVSVDTVLRRLLDSSAPRLHRLDSAMTNWSEQDLCSTVDEAEQMIDQRPDKARPIFLYTQPQNMHVVALHRAQTLRPPQDIYPGFQASPATELKRLDGCFGGFLRYLKARGLYDNSIIVLTADHGEAYGELGHKNHAFGLFPATLRIPLIIHVPSAMRKQYYSDPQAVAFNIDVTPTLYYLLGHRPIVDDGKFGRPLFTLSREEHEAYRRTSYLVAVCYGPVYGILGANGESLFVQDEMEDTSQYFDLIHDPEGSRNVLNDRISTEDQRLIRYYVQDIGEFYHYRHQAPTLLTWMVH